VVHLSSTKIKVRIRINKDDAGVVSGGDAGGVHSGGGEGSRTPPQ